MTIEGDPWFDAVDVLRCIGMYASNNLNNHIRKLAADQKFKATRSNFINLFIGVKHAPSLMLISESGLYKLLMPSDKPEAKPFQDRITKAVIPTIRKTGQYDHEKDSGRSTLLIFSKILVTQTGVQIKKGLLLHFYLHYTSLVYHRHPL